MSWFNSSAGKKLLQTEQFVIQSLIDDKFGYFAIQLGNYDCNFLARSRISKRII